MASSALSGARYSPARAPVASTAARRRVLTRDTSCASSPSEGHEVGTGVGTLSLHPRRHALPCPRSRPTTLPHGVSAPPLTLSTSSTPGADAIPARRCLPQQRAGMMPTEVLPVRAATGASKQRATTAPMEVLPSPHKLALEARRSVQTLRIAQIIRPFGKTRSNDQAKVAGTKQLSATPIARHVINWRF